jgi:hypothetical protein
VDISTSGRSGGSDDDRSATSSGDGNDGKLCNGPVLPVSRHFGLRMQQDQWEPPVQFQLMTSPSLLQ